MFTAPIVLELVAAVVCLAVAVWLVRRAIAERRIAKRLGIWH